MSINLGYNFGKFVLRIIKFKKIIIAMIEKSSEQIKEPLIEKESQAPAPNVNVGSMLSLFRHADSKDKIQIFFGTICALGTGCSFPFFMIFFGDVLGAFYEPNRQHSTELAFEVTKKFFIIGGATWFLGNILSII